MHGHPHRPNRTGTASALTAIRAIHHPLALPAPIKSPRLRFAPQHHPSWEQRSTLDLGHRPAPSGNGCSHAPFPASSDIVPSCSPTARRGAAGNHPTPPHPGKDLALSDPGRPRRPKLRVSSRWEQPSFWQTSQRCSVLSSSKERSQPWVWRATARWGGGAGGAATSPHPSLWGHPPTWPGRKCSWVTVAVSLCKPVSSTPGAPYLGGAVKETTRVENPLPPDSPNSPQFYQ